MKKYGHTRTDCFQTRWDAKNIIYGDLYSIIEDKQLWSGPNLNYAALHGHALDYAGPETNALYGRGNNFVMFDTIELIQDNLAEDFFHE